MNILTKLILKELEHLIDRIKTGNCVLTEEESMDILKIIAHEPLSKDRASSYLNIGKSKFDELVRSGKIPKGRKIRGFKELRWYRDELMAISKSPN